MSQFRELLLPLCRCAWFFVVVCFGCLFLGGLFCLCVFLGLVITASDRLDDYNLAYNLTRARIWRYIVVLERCLFFSAILHYRLWGFAAGLVNGLDHGPIHSSQESHGIKNHMERDCQLQLSAGAGIWRCCQEFAADRSGTRPAHGLMIYCKGLGRSAQFVPWDRIAILINSSRC